MRSWTTAGAAFLVAGLLEIAFFGLSLLGVVVGGAMTAGTVLGELGGIEGLAGPVVLIFYGVWLVVTGVAGPLHVLAGGHILSGRRNRKLLWVATGVSLLPTATVYCAPTSLIAGVLGLLVAIARPDADAAPPSA